MPPISQTASGNTAVLEYRPTETLPLLGAMLLDFARLCRRCRPERPPKWRKTRVFPGTEAISGERPTVRWREMDSNHWYRGTKAVDLRSIPGIAGDRRGS